MNEQHQREEAIFDAAFPLPPEQRAAFLNDACAGDQPLRQRVESLLQSHEKTSGVLEGAIENKTLRLSVPPSEKPGDKIGRYKLLQQIGEGGCGVVYMAEQEEPVRRRVALKIIKLGMDTKQVIARFEAERQALAMMEHPNIAKVLDAGATETGRPYFVMELVRGVRITDYCDEHKIATEERLKLFLQICQAIQHAHQKGVIHRDIKPSNVLVTINDGVPVPKVIDFGIAKSTQGRLTDQTLFTAFEQFIGTPAYMSPEQAVMTSLDVDTRSDIYSLGVLLYELLTGRTPFDQKELLAAGLEEMRRTIREKEPPRPSTRLSTMAADALSTTAQHRHTDVPKLIHLLHGDLDWIVMKALDKDRTRRYETANGLAMDIERHLNNEPVVARPPTRFYRFQKLARRNKLAFGAAAAVVTALVIGLAASTWLFVREKHAHQQAVAAEQAAEKARAEESKLRQQAELGNKIAALELAMTAGKFEEAQALIEQVPLAVLKDHLRALGGYGALRAVGLLGDWHAEHTRWQAAFSYFTMLNDLFPDDNAVDYPAMIHHSLAPLLVQMGDIEGYRRHCQQALVQFGGTKHPLIADRIAKDCSILASSGVDLDVVAKMLDTALTEREHYPNLSIFFETTKALAEYRRGRYASAVEWSQKRLPAGRTPFRNAEAYLVLAMAQHQLQRPQEARAALAEGVRIVDTEMPKLEGGDLGMGEWQDWIITHALLNEAKALIEGKPASNTEVKSKVP
jgi:serine/threonine protein kinase